MTDLMTAKLSEAPLTFFHRNWKCQNSAIDRVFCTPEAVKLTVSVETITGHGISDHSGILWRYGMQKPQHQTASHRWRFNPSLLMDDYCRLALDRATDLITLASGNPLQRWHTLKESWKVAALSNQRTNLLVKYRTIRQLLSKAESNTSTDPVYLALLRKR